MEEDVWDVFRRPPGVWEVRYFILPPRVMVSGAAPDVVLTQGVAC